MSNSKFAFLISGKSALASILVNRSLLSVFCAYILPIVKMSALSSIAVVMPPAEVWALLITSLNTSCSSFSFCFFLFSSIIDCVYAPIFLPVPLLPGVPLFDILLSGNGDVLLPCIVNRFESVTLTGSSKVTSVFSNSPKF